MPSPTAKSSNFHTAEEITQDTFLARHTKSYPHSGIWGPLSGLAVYYCHTILLDVASKTATTDGIA